MQKKAGTEAKPAFTELCVRRVKIGDADQLISDQELREGWTLVRHRISLRLYKAKVWPSSGLSRVSELPHRKGDIMRTYDDISMTRLSTYRIDSNPRYRAAVQGLHLARKRRREFREHHGNTDGLAKNRGSGLARVRRLHKIY